MQLLPSFSIFNITKAPESRNGELKRNNMKKKNVNIASKCRAREPEEKKFYSNTVKMKVKETH